MLLICQLIFMTTHENATIIFLLTNQPTMASDAILCHMHVCESLFKSLSIATNSLLVEETE
jgi:hypothetical protein